ncbi:MAG: ribosome small subunit-dependent GTPase A [Eubacteriales bacterium]|nr:ribosome small subunit-dependent GTPase A [Eubacteriales bacterium]
MTARIIEGRGGIYTVQNKLGEKYVLRVGNKFRYNKMTPLVGDIVKYSPGEDDSHGWIDEILPRKNSLVRPPVANIDRIGIVIAEIPQPDFLLVDKILLNAFMQKIEPIIIVNKVDLGEQALKQATQSYSAAGVNVIGVSALQDNTLDKIKELFSGAVACFAGQSGVGKSTLLSKLLNLPLETGKLSRKTSRGKQTTRHTSLFIEGDFMLLDTPGFSLLEVPQIEPQELLKYYPEFALPLGQCKFSPCFHDSEPQCAVKDMVEKGLIDSSRHERYKTLKNQIVDNWKNRYS